MISKRRYYHTITTVAQLVALPCLLLGLTITATDKITKLLRKLIVILRQADHACYDLSHEIRSQAYNHVFKED